MIMREISLLITTILLLVNESHQGCKSTVAITTCTKDEFKSGQPLRLNDYKRLLTFESGDVEKIPEGTFKLLSGLSTLQLSSHNIRRLESGSFEGLNDLKTLTLYDNKIEHLPKNIFGHCRKLHVLDLGQNQIENFDDNTLTALTALEELNLGFNKLKAVPKDIKSLRSLKILRLHNNQIKKLEADQFGNLNKLEILELYDNQLTHIADNAFRGLRNLKELVLVNNYLSNLNANDIIASLPALKTLKININSFDCKTLGNIVTEFRKKHISVPQGTSTTSNTVAGMSCKKV